MEIWTCLYGNVKLHIRTIQSCQGETFSVWQGRGLTYWFVWLWFYFSQLRNWILKSQQRVGGHSFLLSTTRSSQMNWRSALPRLSATGPHWGKLHTINAARYIQTKRVLSASLNLVCTSVPKMILCTGLWNQATRRSLASPAWATEIQILSGASDVHDWSWQVSYCRV